MKQVVSAIHSMIDILIYFNLSLCEGGLYIPACFHNSVIFHYIIFTYTVSPFPLSLLCAQVCVGVGRIQMSGADNTAELEVLKDMYRKEALKRKLLYNQVNHMDE